MPGYTCQEALTLLLEHCILDQQLPASLQRGKKGGGGEKEEEEEEKEEEEEECLKEMMVETYSQTLLQIKTSKKHKDLQVRQTKRLILYQESL